VGSSVRALERTAWTCPFGRGYTAEAVTTVPTRQSPRRPRRPLSAAEPRLRPLLARPGARFACFSDGLCCTDVHALGPITKSEARDMRALASDSVWLSPDVDAPCMKPVAGGGCYFLKGGLCQVHAKHGAKAKPTGCQRFPFGLIATPHGGRVSTESRCPCRTLGERPPVNLAEAESALLDRAGRLEPDLYTPARIALSRTERVGFERYAALEASLLARLAAGEAPRQVLGAEPLPKRVDGSWPETAAAHLDMDDGSAGGVALAWFGDALLELSAGHQPPRRERPWSKAFDKAIARTPTPQRPADMFADWVADELWMLRWVGWEVSFDVARAELVTRLALAELLKRRLQRQAKLRADQAVAEALMIVELATAGSVWPEALEDVAR
jgi:hypothetical protein